MTVHDNFEMLEPDLHWDTLCYNSLAYLYQKRRPELIQTGKKNNKTV